MRSLTLSVLFASWCASAGAETAFCAGSVTVAGGDPALRAETCGFVDKALKGLASCSLVLDRPIRINIVEKMREGCVGLYYCGEDQIELVAPAYAEQERSTESPFRQLSPEDFFASVVTHELAHAAYDAAGCPFETCPVTDEYVAYAMQVRSLSPEQIAAFEDAGGIDRRVSREEFSQIFLMMNPNAFAARVWAHFSQRPDGCAYLAQIVSGDIVFDTERP